MNGILFLKYNSRQRRLMRNTRPNNGDVPRKHLSPAGPRQECRLAPHLC